MFERIGDFFRGQTSLKIDKNGSPTDKDLHIAAIVVLIEMACSDNEFLPEELDTIVEIMSHRFELPQNEVGELMEISKFLRKDGEKINEFISIVNECFDDNQRQMLLSMAWQVVTSDNHAHEDEVAFAAKLRKRLNLSLEQAVRAQQMATEQ
ncbi:TerB family tellurite resistance protein [Oligoflexia bacterium]|nr:TerB family tellurite resistance protein [Oligoflexia bacterium]